MIRFIYFKHGGRERETIPRDPKTNNPSVRKQFNKY